MYVCVSGFKPIDTDSSWALLFFLFPLKSAGFWLVHTPILTSSDCEGAGELFSVQVGRTGHVQVGSFVC